LVDAVKAGTFKDLDIKTGTGDATATRGRVVAVAPEARGRGLGLVLHHRGLSTMMKEQPRRFLSSTDASNVAMRRIFEKLGYEDAGVQHYFEPL